MVADDDIIVLISRRTRNNTVTVVVAEETTSIIGCTEAINIISEAFLSPISFGSRQMEEAGATEAEDLGNIWLEWHI